jgi:hypothetical protein
MSVCKKVEEDYAWAGMNVISKEELYGGKICAALDRQHPRDLFDMAGLFSEGGLTDSIVQGFVAMMLGHNRPVHELLNPFRKKQQTLFEKDFQGMSDTTYSYEDHERTFDELIRAVNKGVVPYREFLLNFISLNPDFETAGIPNLEMLPSVRWKLHNLEYLQKTNPVKFREQRENLERIFST